MDDTQKVGVDVEVDGVDKAKKDTKSLIDIIEKNTEAFNKLTNALDKNSGAEKSNNSEKEKSISTNKRMADSLANIGKKLTLPNIKHYAKMISSVARRTIELTKYSVDYIENLNLMDTAFGENSQAARKWVDNIAEIYGFDESGLTRQLGTFRQFGAALGFANDKADLLSKNLTLMAGDVSSLYNITFTQASEKLTSALTGQTKAIRSLGADITQASLQQELYRMGINESISDMNRAEKTLLIYISLERQLANAQGDLAKTLESPSNQMKIFSEQVKRLARAIGNALLPALASILPVVNGVLMALTEVFNFIAGLFGYEQADFDFGGALSSLEDLGSGFDDVASGADNAGNSTKKLKKELLGLRGFDKLNVITTPKDTGSTGSGGSSGIGGVAGGGINSKLLDALKEYDAHLDQAGKKAQKIRDSILEWLGFTRDANGEWKLTDVTWGNVLVSAIGILGAFKLIKGIGKLLGLGNIGKGMVDVFKKVATLIGGKGLVSGGSATGGIAGGLGTSLGILSAVVVLTVSYFTNLKTASKIIDNMKTGTGEELTLWEKINLVYMASNPLLAQMVGTQKLITYATEDSIKKVDMWGDSISKATKDKLKPLYDDLEILDKKLLEIDFNDKIIDKKDVQVIKDRISSISKHIVDELDADKNEQLGRLKGMKQILGEEDYKKIIDSTTKYYDQRIKTVEGNEKKITKIIENANKENRTLTEDEIKKINKLRDDNEKIGLVAATENQKELETIYLRGKYNREAITVKEASNILKSAKKTYEGVVKDAEKTRIETIDEANKMREAGTITEKQYEKIVKAANKTKEDTIKEAKDQYDGIKKETEKGLGDNAKFIDKNTGEVKSNWQVWWEDLKKGAGNGVIGIKAKVSEKWYDIKKWYREKIQPFFTKKYWQEKWDTIKEKVGDGVQSAKLKLQEKWREIKKWLDEHVFKYFTKSYWEEKWNNIKNAIKLPKINIKDVVSGTTTGSVKGVDFKANGGFVETGQLFVAREKGAELVGSIGNKTAVANNDQIVQAVSIGVQNAIARSGIGNARVVIEATGDSSGLMDFITFKQKQQERQYGL